MGLLAALKAGKICVLLDPDLGGHSLALARVISRITDAFRAELSAQALYASSTVAAMTLIVTQHWAHEARPEDVERLLVEAEGLSDDDLPDR